jgi:hypothetical protein
MAATELHAGIIRTMRGERRFACALNSVLPIAHTGSLRLHQEASDDFVTSIFLPKKIRPRRSPIQLQMAFKAQFDLAPTSDLVDAAQQVGRILVDAERTGLPQLVRPIAAA